MSSVKTYIGFANKSGAIIKGVDDIMRSKKIISLIIASEELKENSRIKIINFAEKKNIPIIDIESGILTELNLHGVKVLAITDNNLANAVKKCINK